MYVGEGIHVSAQTKEPCALKKAVILGISSIFSSVNLYFMSSIYCFHLIFST